MLKSICGVVIGITVLAAQPAYLMAAETGARKESVSLGELFGDRFDDVVGEALPRDYKINLQLYVPARYNTAEPAGVLVYISPTRSGRPPKAWEDVFADYNLIWVSVNYSGNRRQAYKRMIEALASLAYVADHYNIDLRRRYLAGFSGGGRISSLLVGHYPTLFSGVIYMSGVNSLAEIPESSIEALKAMRFVFITGSRDFNRDETKRFYLGYEQAGFDLIKLIDDPTMRHSTPNASRLREAIEFLDLFRAPTPPDRKVE